MLDWLLKYPLDAYRTATLEFAYDGPSVLIVGTLGAAALALAVLLWRRPGLSAGRRLTLLSLQLALVGFVLTLAAQPELVDEQPVRGANTLALVLDDSASMAYPDDGAPRIDQARSWLDELATSPIADTYTLQRYLLSDIAAASADFAATTPTQTETPLGDRLAALVSQRAGDALAGVVVVSDGLATDPVSDATLAALNAANVPVFGRLVGRTAVPEDLALVELTAPKSAAAGARFDIAVTIAHDGPGTSRLRVTTDSDALLASQPIDLPVDTTRTRVLVPLTINEPGFHTLTVAIEPIDGELERRNNRARRVVHVPERARRILYYEGEPRWEYKFLRRAVHALPNLAVTSLLRVSPNKFYRQGLASPDELTDGFPADAATLFAFDAIILGSLEAAALSAAQHELLRDFVSRRGGSLLLLAGPNGLGNGGWGESALAPALPTTLPPFGSDTFQRERGAVRPTLYGSETPYLQLADDPAAGWDALPQVANFQDVGTPRPAALTLLSVRTDTGNRPLLVTQPYGRGRSFVLGTSGTWRWQMQLPVEDTRHATFWRQLLAAMTATAPDTATVRASATDTQVTIDAEFLDDDYKAQAGLVIKANIDSTATGDAAELLLTPDPERAGHYTGTMPIADAGVHYVEVSAFDGDAPMADARSAFAGPGVAAEFRRVRADDAALSALARASGGQLLTTMTLADVTTALASSSASVTEIRRRPIWDAPLMLLALLLLKSMEWLLRRRWGQI